MQTFLPYPDFAASATVLDPLRRGRQRVEALQVLRALTVPGYEEALVRYGLEMCGHWCSLGRPDTCAATMTTWPTSGHARTACPCDHTTSKAAIIAMSSCSRLWQCRTYRPR
ncbi:hypothetical protein SAMN05444920_104732 [Nonomuraea solani]|uniref:Uncharacterized protein n=1 Tax=Nonomuraea solani TaxID=1144553 RepID=A0A1H6D3R5_9ACTN|nr:pyrimidine dimer DNA glycosylase/endonuclease V [Nonomuraea solani]SEG79648.1 hypothetical protein SAMN05444920_104732 [Nonomuraea solani]